MSENDDRNKLERALAREKPKCIDCKRRPGMSRVLDRERFKRTGEKRILRLCDHCLKDRLKMGDPSVGPIAS